MLTIEVPIGEEGFDEATQKFVVPETFTVEMEHSLASISKWESKWEKPFLSQEEKTNEQSFDYLQMMCLTPDVPPEIWYALTPENTKTIQDYIAAKMTATWFYEDNAPGPRNREIVTAEVVYYWMVTMNIPFECQYWHFNRLITLVRVINKKNEPPKKMSPREVAARNRRLNEQRQAQYGTRG